MNDINKIILKHKFTKYLRWNWDRDFLVKPTYLDDNDSLNYIYKLQRLFFTKGKVKLGCIVQANNLLYKKLDIDCPATIIYTSDQYYYEHPEKLEELSEALFVLKGVKDFDDDLQEIADLLEDEISREFKIIVPKRLTEGRDVFITTTVIHRKQIPNGYIDRSIYPVLTLDNEKVDAIILPKWYWEKKLKL